MKKSSGFTLIELLIVMAVLAILINIGATSFRGMQTEASQTQAQLELQTLQSAVEQYYMHHNALPPAGNWQDTLMAEPSALLEYELRDPFMGMETYHYEWASNYYVIWSYGPDRTSAVLRIEDDGNIVAVNQDIADDIYITNGIFDEDWGGGGGIGQ